MGTFSFRVASVRVGGLTSGRSSSAGSSRDGGVVVTIGTLRGGGIVGSADRERGWLVLSLLLGLGLLLLLLGIRSVLLSIRFVTLGPTLRSVTLKERDKPIN
jgi:hypothetical protein